MAITPGQISATNTLIKKSDKVLINSVNISYVNDWTELITFEPSYVGKQVLIKNGISASSISGAALARRGSSVWGIPGADNNGIIWLGQHPIPSLYGYQFIVPDGITEAEYTNPTTQTYAIIITNRQSSNILSVRVRGMSTVSSHATILGCVVGTGSINSSNFSASTWTQVTLSGSNSWTPGNGNSVIRKYWRTDEITLPVSIAPGSSFVLRMTIAAGNFSYPNNGSTTARTNFNDFMVGWSNDTGDFGSSISAAGNNPSGWNLGIASLAFGVELKRSTSDHARHAAWGDSIIEGASGSLERDIWVYNAMQNMSGGKEIVSFGRGGFTVQQVCSTFVDWLQNDPSASLFNSCSINGWSWNNQDTNATDMNNYMDSAVAAGVAAGKRMSVWFPTPAGLQTGGYGNITTRTDTKAHAVSMGYIVVDTSAPITSGTDIIPAYTVEGVHLNSAGQIIMGQQIALNESLIFG